MYRYTRSSNQRSLFTGQVLELDEIERFAPAVMSQAVGERCSKRYRHIDSGAVLRGMVTEGFRPFEVRQTVTRKPGREQVAKHLIRFRHERDMERSASGGLVPEVIMLNAHDGTSAYKMLSGCFRMVCSNGLIAGDIRSDQSVRHTGDVANKVIEASYTVLDDTVRVMDGAAHMGTITLSRPEQDAFAEAAAELRWERDDNGNSTAPIHHQQLLIPARFEDRADDVFTTMNVIQERIMRGGLRGRSETGRRTTTRPVEGVTENVKLNRALWTLAERMAALKGSPVTAAA